MEAKAEVIALHHLEGTFQPFKKGTPLYVEVKAIQARKDAAKAAALAANAGA